MPDTPIGSPETGKPPTRFEFNMLLGFVIGIAFVAVLGFITLTLSYFTSSQSAFQDLKDQVTAQNAKMDVLIQEYGKK